MKKMQTLYKIESILSVIIGAFLLINAKTQVIGAVIGLENVTQNISIGWGSFFLICGVALFVILEMNK